MNISSKPMTETKADHVQWLADRHKTREAELELPDDAPEEGDLSDKVEGLIVLLATVPATTHADLVAQIAWFKEDLGEYVFGNASPAHDLIFETLAAGVQNRSK